MGTTQFETNVVDNLVRTRAVAKVCILWTQARSFQSCPRTFEHACAKWGPPLAYLSSHLNKRDFWTHVCPERVSLLEVSLGVSYLKCRLEVVLFLKITAAGGYDAVWLLVLDSNSTSDSSPISLIESVWSSWKELDVSPLSAVENRGCGVRVEQLEAIPGLLDRLG